MSEDIDVARWPSAELQAVLTPQDHGANTIPRVSPLPVRGSAELTIAIPTLNDFDGTWFTIASLRLHHAHLMGSTQILILDNHPFGEEAVALRDLASWIPNVYYVPVATLRSTAVCGMAFRFAAAEVVMVLDSHVLLPAGAPDAVLAHFRDHPGTRDLVQGPVLDPGGGEVAATHCAEVWSGGAYSWWELDARGVDPAEGPFPVPMQGLGAFACRSAAWPGLHPRLRGYSCNEWYVHEKFRRRGGNTLCLPGFRWHHRFPRPAGVPYDITWQDRIRNYLLCWRELGLETRTMTEHFSEIVGPDFVRRVVEETEEELAFPYGDIDGVLFARHRDSPDEREAREAAEERKIPFRVIESADEPDPEASRIMTYRRCLQFAYLHRWDRPVIVEPGSRPARALASRHTGETWGHPGKLLCEVPPDEDHHGSCTIGYTPHGVTELLRHLPTDPGEVLAWRTRTGSFHAWLTRIAGERSEHHPTTEVV
ncbi:hypothetical protein FHR84_003265 [Actinopolyspora biskrensis]|uniref:Uncharacterized protein n=1 Tax=Actinopolyspora biskrensis TaxID=1470178 RepID=A0A852Z8P9_9ACTN|nr:glycosyltransferase family 2 protein [Actinopolyspora biskrensis]NYH79916.1 hypothetical protein [Actinopolyspora biskrensis]